MVYLSKFFLIFTVAVSFPITKTLIENLELRMYLDSNLILIHIFQKAFQGRKKSKRDLLWGQLTFNLVKTALLARKRL